MKKERIFWGLFFIVAAAFLLVSRLGLVEGISFMTLLLTVFFAAMLIKSAMHKSVPGVLFSAAFLCILYDDLLGIESITPWSVLGAALLGSIGVSFLYHPKRNYYYNHHCGSEWADAEAQAETVGDAQMEFNTAFGSSVKYINSDDFRSAKVRCSFGAMKVYFDNAVVQSGEAIVNLDVSFSGVELYIPAAWNVINSADCMLGGIDEKNKNRTTGSPVLRITGKVSFGGVEIIYI